MEFKRELTIDTVPPQTRTPPPVLRCPSLAVFPLMVHESMVTEPTQTWIPPPPKSPAELPLMVHDEMVTVPPRTMTPPPPPKLALFPLMVQDEMATVPPWT